MTIIRESDMTARRTMLFRMIDSKLGEAIDGPVIEDTAKKLVAGLRRRYRTNACYDGYGTVMGVLPEGADIAEATCEIHGQLHDALIKLVGSEEGFNLFTTPRRALVGLPDGTRKELHYLRASIYFVSSSKHKVLVVSNDPRLGSPTE